MPVADPANHICGVIEIKGPITPQQCEAALERVSERQEALRNPLEKAHTYLNVSDFWMISLALETMMSTRVETGTQDRNRCMLIV